VHRWIDWWNAYWFPETSTLRLAVCRIVIVAAQLFWFFPSLAHQKDILEKSTGFINPEFLILTISSIIPSELFFTPEVFTGLAWVTYAAGIATLFGLCTRPSAFLFALGNWILVAHQYSYGEDHHTEALLCIFLMLLALSPSGDSLSIDALLRRRYRLANERAYPAAKVETAFWPLRLMQVLLAWTYFSTGLTKLMVGGLEWINGHTLQQYMFADAIRSGRPLGLWVAQQHTLCLLLSIFTILFEVFFFLVLLIQSAVYYFLIAGVIFHIGIYVMMGAPFFQHIFLYAVFIDFDRWKDLLGKTGVIIIKVPHRKQQSA
jgi:uncharacterized membrane protein YphA (DoxX/SURF4 family)